jgi:hypothetical protein
MKQLLRTLSTVGALIAADVRATANGQSGAAPLADRAHLKRGHERLQDQFSEGSCLNQSDDGLYVS